MRLTAADRDRVARLAVALDAPCTVTLADGEIVLTGHDGTVETYPTVEEACQALRASWVVVQ